MSRRQTPKGRGGEPVTASYQGSKDSYTTSEDTTRVSAILFAHAT